MSSIILGAHDSYVNIGTATAWRRTLLNHATSMWIKTTTPTESCLLSLSNKDHEVFSIDINVPLPEHLDGSIKFNDPMASSTLLSPTNRSPMFLNMSNLASSPKLTSGTALPSPSAYVQPKPEEQARKALRVRLEDVDRHVVEVYTDVPNLCDNHWHLVEVEVTEDGDSIRFRIDGKFVNAQYAVKEKLTEFTSSGIVEKPLYPASDLLGARNHQRHLSDFYCGRLADVTVSEGGLDGPRLHWWITDMNQGTTVWDRGQYSAQPPGMHLHCCDIKWDTVDFPAASLSLNGFSGSYAVVKELSAGDLADIANNDLPTPASGQFQQSPSALGSLQTPSVSPTAAGALSAGLLLASPGIDKRSPMSTSINSRSISQAKKNNMAVSFTVWIRTTSKQPAVVVTVPTPECITMALNYDGKTPSITLLVNQDAFVCISDVCDGQWRQIQWVVDPETGVHLYVDGQLSTWEPMTLSELRMGVIVKPRRPSAADSESAFAVGRSREESTAANDGEMKEELTSFTAFGDGPEPGSPAATAVNRKSSRVSFAFGGSVNDTSQISHGSSSDDDDDSHIGSNETPREVDDNTDFFMNVPQASAPAMPSFARSSILDDQRETEVREIRDSASILEYIGNFAREVKQASDQHRESFAGSSTGISPLAIKKDANSRNNSTFSLGGASEDLNQRPRSPASDMYVMVGRYFDGLVREFSLSVGPFDFYWPLADGVGRVLRSRLRPSSLQLAGVDINAMQSVSISALNPNFTANLEVNGRFVTWPKTLWPTSCIDFYPGQQLDLGTVMVPHTQEVPIVVECFVRLYESTSKERCYGHVVEIERLMVMELAKEKVIITVPTGQPAASTPTASTPQSQKSAADADGEELGERMVPLVCSTLLIEDGKWHLIRVEFPCFDDTLGAKMWIDETPVELVTQELATEAGDSDKATTATTTSLGLEVQLPLSLSKPSVMMMDDDAMNHTLDDLESTSTFRSLADEHRTRMAALIRSFIPRKKEVLLMARPQEMSLGMGSLPTMRSRIFGGGVFRGSIQRLHFRTTPSEEKQKKNVLTNSNSYWPLDEGFGSRLRRYPVTMDPALAKHPNHAPLMNVVTTAASEMSHTGKLGLKPHDWQPTRLPAMALRFNGSSTYVTVGNISSHFNPKCFADFSIVMWMKDAGDSSHMGCVASIHDISSPIVEASTGIFTHTRLNTRASPKKRYHAPFVTTFILADSSERYLALETDYDLYNGLWHKVEWVVTDAEENSAMVLVDGKQIDVTVVCSECPSDFRENDVVMNIGARDEGDGGVNSHYGGDIRCLRLFASDNTIVSYLLDETEGSVAYDDCERFVGRIVDPQWVLTTFPPLTPVFEPETGMEFSPCKDMEQEWLKGGVTINATLMTKTKRRGAVLTVLSSARRVVAAFTINEGGDAATSVPEKDTHTFIILHKTKRKVTMGSESGCPLRSPVSASFDVDRHNSLSVNGASPQRGRLRADERRRSTLTPNTDNLEASFENDNPLGSQSMPSMRRAVSRKYIKDMLDHDAEEVKNNEKLRIAHERDATREVEVIEELVFQVHHGELCDGRWHHIRIDVARDPENSVFAIDNTEIPMLLIARTTVTEDRHASMRGKRMSDITSWDSFIVGRAPELGSFRGCLKGVSVYTQKGDMLLFVPLAGSTKFTSQSSREVATSNVKWELAVPPPSCVYLANAAHVILPPIPTFTFSSFKVSLRIRTPSLVPACIMELGNPDRAYFCLMINQDSHGNPLQNTIRGVLRDATGAEMQVYCRCTLTLSDNKWHDVEFEVTDSASNEARFVVDSKEQTCRYGECGGPKEFPPIEEGGALGARILDLAPVDTLQALLQKVVLSTPSTGEVHADWELNGGYGEVLSDSSGKRNHARAVRVIWRSEIRAPDAFEVPRKAVDLFERATILVSRWSNNPYDECKKSQVTRETIIPSWPEDGWRAGASGPQWISLDLGQLCTIFSVEIVLHRASPSHHELWFSRSNLSTSRVANMPVPPDNKRIPGKSMAESWTIKSTSSRVLRTSFRAPQFNVRWLRILTTQSTTPVSVQSIRILGFTGGWQMRRTYSIMEMRRPLVDMEFSPESASLSNTPQTSASLSLSQQGSPASTRLQGAAFGGFAESGSFLNTSAGPLEELEIATIEQIVPKKKSQEEKAREMKLLFYTMDVERTGFIEVSAFIKMYKDQDLIGTTNEDRIVGELRDAGVSDTLMDFQQFRKIMARMELW